ncbi:MAG TPA: hypothetical protein VM529_09625 [Gemmata sp.]|nr:hypothetical protein [Gemmata sp.]
MTEPIAVDVPAKPATPAAAPPKVELPKPTAKPAEPSKPPFPRPAAPAATGPGLLERLGRNKAGVGAAALFSLAAGIAGFAGTSTAMGSVIRDSPYMVVVGGGGSSIVTGHWSLLRRRA